MDFKLSLLGVKILVGNAGDTADGLILNCCRDRDRMGKSASPMAYASFADVLNPVLLIWASRGAGVAIKGG